VTGLEPGVAIVVNAVANVATAVAVFSAARTLKGLLANLNEASKRLREKDTGSE
jgi:hypothetical protein